MALTNLDYALGYSRLGWRVFPVWPGDKRPLYAGWPQDATTDEKMVRQYFGGDPSRNIGIVCGEAFEAWDIEVEHLPAFNAWCETNGAIPESPVARTGRGGMHILTQPTVGHTRNLYLDGVHIGELKSTGGFIVVAPSKTVDTYQWTWAPIGMRLAEAPDWFTQLLEKPQTGVRKFPNRLTNVDEVVAVLDKLGHAVLNAGEGRRNSYLYWAARRALEEGVPAKYVAKDLSAAAIHAGLDHHEAEATIRSAYEAEGMSV